MSDANSRGLRLYRPDRPDIRSVVNRIARVRRVNPERLLRLVLKHPEATGADLDAATTRKVAFAAALTATVGEG